MANRQKSGRGGISDAAVRAKTGRGWLEWFTILDRARASGRSHREIVALIAAEGAPPWWCRMITVSYEQERGLRTRYERADGFAVSRSRTIGAAVDTLWDAWSSPSLRRQWLGEQGLTIRKETPGRSLRIKWPDGSSVEVVFRSEGDEKSRITVQHSRLRDAGEAAARKEYWGRKLDALRRRLIP
jgi:hypothetical protein